MDMENLAVVQPRDINVHIKSGAYNVRHQQPWMSMPEKQSNKTKQYCLVGFLM